MTLPMQTSDDAEICGHSDKRIDGAIYTYTSRTKRMLDEIRTSCCITVTWALSPQPRKRRTKCYRPALAAERWPYYSLVKWKTNLTSFPFLSFLPLLFSFRISASLSPFSSLPSLPFRLFAETLPRRQMLSISTAEIQAWQKHEQVAQLWQRDRATHVSSWRF